MRSERVEWLCPDNPSKLFIINTVDVHISNIPKNFTKEDLFNWLRLEHDEYIGRCEMRKKVNKFFTFSNFDDVVEYVKSEGFIPGYIKTIILPDGDKVIGHGRHRWAAAYLCGVKELPTVMGKLIVEEV